MLFFVNDQQFFTCLAEFSFIRLPEAVRELWLDGVVVAGPKLDETLFVPFRGAQAHATLVVAPLAESKRHRLFGWYIDTKRLLCLVGRAADADADV